MFCSQCGAPLNENETVCPVCGTACTSQQSSDAANRPNSTPILVYGIVSLALAELGLVGLILSLIARAKTYQYLAAGGQLFGKAKVGNILRRVALPLSIFMTIFWIVYVAIFVIVFALSAGAFTFGIANLSDSFDLFTILF